MKRPTKKPQKVKLDAWKNPLIHYYVEISPDELRKVADKMESDGIISLMLEENYEGCDIYHFRLETEEESKKRYDEQYRQWKAWKKREQELEKKVESDIIEKAKKLGMVFKEG